tara:strand:+ start:1239 stop:2387 length:1149 start_codon:yes stop_codon:yes gene_type:complete
MAKQTLHSDFFLTKEEKTETSFETLSAEELEDHKLILKNKIFFNNIVESFDNFDNKYLTLFFNDQAHIAFQVGDTTVLEVARNYIRIIIDSISLGTSDYKHLLKTLDNKQIDVLEENYDGLIQLYIKTEISDEESETILTSFSIALSKIFGSSYTVPDTESNKSLLDYFGFKPTEETDQNNPVLYEDKIDEKIVSLLSGEKSNIEYKQSMIDDNQGQKFSGSIMFDMTLKTIAGFANSYSGGSLLIGIADDQFDTNTNLHWVDPRFIRQIKAQFKNEDNFVLKLGAALKQRFDKVLLTTISMEFLEIEQDNNKVKFLHIFVPAYSQPVFIKFTCKDSQLNPFGVKTELFYVRYAHNSTETLTFSETISFISQRFPKYLESLH